RVGRPATRRSRHAAPRPPRTARRARHTTPAPPPRRARRRPARLGPTRTGDDTGPPALRTPHGTAPAVRSVPRPRPEPTAHRPSPTAGHTAAPSHRPAQPSHHPRTAAPPRPPAPATPRTPPDRAGHR